MADKWEQCWYGLLTRPEGTHVNTTAARDAIDLGRDWAEAPRWQGIDRDYSPEDVIRLRGSAANRAHARPPRRREALAPARRGGLPRRTRRTHGRPGGADGEGGPEGDLPLRLAGRRRRQPRGRRVPRPEPLPGEQRARDGAAAEQRAPARRPDRVGRGQGGRCRLPAPDRRRRRGRLRRPAERVRADEGDDRGGRRRRPLRGSALVGEEVRPSRRQGARPDRTVHPHAPRRPPRRGRARGARPSSSRAPTRTRRR